MSESAFNFKGKTYQSFLKKVRPLLEADTTQSIVNLNEVRLKNYWNIGHQLLSLQKRFPKKRFLYQQSSVLRRMAEDLKTTSPLLYRMVLFHRTWDEQIPHSDTKEYLSWGQHYELLSLPDSESRRFYHDQALSQNWNRDALRAAIKMKLYEQTQNSGKHGTIPELKTAFYTFKATPLRVLDGDTIFAKIELGFHLNYEPMLRLRGINTPELGKDPTGRAAQAKARLEEILTGLKFIVAKTYKTDVYGRYLTDIYYHPTLTTKEEVLEKGIFLNQQLLDEGLADWLVM